MYVNRTLIIQSLCACSVLVGGSAIAQTSDHSGSNSTSSFQQQPQSQQSMPNNSGSSALPPNGTGSTVSPPTDAANPAPSATIRLPASGVSTSNSTSNSAVEGSRSPTQMPVVRPSSINAGRPNRPENRLGSVNDVETQQSLRDQGQANRRAATVETYEDSDSKVRRELSKDSSMKVTQPRARPSSRMNSTSASRATDSRNRDQMRSAALQASSPTLNLARNADTFLSAKIRQDLLNRNPAAVRGVTVQTVDGTVYLRGNVPSPADKDMVFGIARGHAQQIPVQNELVIRR